MRERFVEEHPSYGMLRLSRCQGGAGVFFGSALKHHSNYFELRLYSASLAHDELGYDHYVQGRVIAEVKLTPPQFIELISSMNMGAGIPVTLKTLPTAVTEGDHRVTMLPPPPDNSKVEAQRVQDGFEDEMKSVLDGIDDSMGEINQILEKKGALTKDEKATIRNAFGTYRRFATDMAPHLLTMFREAAEKVVVQAKQEVDAMVTSFVQRTGMQALHEKGLLRLPSADAEDDTGT